MATKNYRVRLVLKDLASIRNLDVDNHCMPIRSREDGMIEMEALVGEVDARHPAAPQKEHRHRGPRGPRRGSRARP